MNSIFKAKVFLTALWSAVMLSGCLARSQSASSGLMPGSAEAVSAEPMEVDRQIADALREVSAEHIRANIEKLVSFGTRSTISAQDPPAIASGRGIGAAREWIKAEFERYSQECGGCLEVKTDSFTQQPAERIPQATEITNVYAVLKGRMRRMRNGSCW